MAHIVLLHSALGLRPAIGEFADRLRDVGHTVETPDYYGGAVFDSEREGITYRDEIGVSTLMKRAQALVADAPANAVLAGFSLGAFFAQAFAMKRPQAKAAILLHSVAAPTVPWNGVPVQVHRYADDPWIEPGDVDALGTAVRSSGADFEDFVTPGTGHLFTDLATSDGNADALQRTLTRITEKLGQPLKP